ncbi:MAG: pyridoxamine 5'-phosphate oxidase family protein, partial [Chloroflexi bacterium]|nr:pyridoxamine 5'-phosphate oxidase family protein [Chloroflexota bacterium]
RGAPQPRPVWFHWDGENVLIFSVNDAAKMRHIARTPRVALNFNSTADGGDVGVIIGEAVRGEQPIPAERMRDYLEKYREGIKGLGMTGEKFAETYGDRLLVTPQTMRGFI